MSSTIPENIWTGTGWKRNPELPPLPEPEVQAPVPGFRGGSFVPHNLAMTIPNAATLAGRPPQWPNIHSSPSAPIAIQHAIPSPVIPPPAQLAQAILAGMPHPTGFHQPGAAPLPPAQPGAVLSPLGGFVVPPSRIAPDEGALEFADVAHISATMLVPSAPPLPAPPAPAPPVPSLPFDPIAEQIAKARAAAQSGKL
jgi:WAS/WASL-interacting protein